MEVRTPVRYELDLSRTRTHQLGVRMTVEAGSEPLDLVMPRLSPGSPVNSLNQPARLSHLGATDARGQAVKLEKTEAGHWRLAEHAAGPVTVHYTVKADEFSHVRSYLSERLAYVNGPSALMYVDGRQHEPSTVELTGVPDSSWRSSSTLARVEGQPHTFYAGCYDDLADTNFLAGQFTSVSSEVRGVKLTVNQNGTPPWAGAKVNGATPEQSLDDLSKLYTAFLDRFGEFPRERYCHHGDAPAGVEASDRYVVTKHYLHGASVNAGGYEHYHGHELMLNKSSQAAIERRYAGDGRAYERNIMAHELMHKLLAKYVRHEGIDSADLSAVRSTDGLWLTEGGVEWAGMALQRQAGLTSPQDYLNGLQEQYRRYLADYAADPSSPRDNSFDAHLGNGQYYNKGAVAASLLDLEVRRLTGGEKSFFDVLKAMKDEFGGQRDFFTIDDVERLSAQTVGSDALQPFFANHLRDRQPFDFETLLGHAGLQLAQRADCWDAAQLTLSPHSQLVCDPAGQLHLSAGTALSPLPEKPTTQLPGLGFALVKTPDGKLKIGGVTPDGPAARAGLGDFIGQLPEALSLRVGGQEVSLPLAAGAAVPEGPVESVRLRFKTSDLFTGQTGSRELTIASGPALRPVLEERADATPAQLALRESWLGRA